MGINLLLKKEGIEEIEKIDTLNINKIAANISDKLCRAFSELNLNQSELFISISRLDMYTAKFPNDLSSAKYIYGNGSIYFSKDINFDDIHTLAIHECIHFLQELKDNKGKLLRLGLYNLSNQTGLGLNEAAVQYMASTASNSDLDSVTYYGMTFNSISPDYYPLECALLNQIVYFTGSYPLYTSTFYSNDIFEKTFIDLVGKDFFIAIQNNFDNLLLLEEDVLSLSSKLLETEDIDKSRQLQEKVSNKKNEITNLFLKMQNLILEKFFQAKFRKVETEKDLKEFQESLYNYKQLLVLTESDTFYNNFYCHMMKDIEFKHNQLQQYGQIIDIPKEHKSLIKLEQTKNNLGKIQSFLNTIKKIIFGKN
ncbi:MAG: hypothetical protein IKG42_00890 [Clostridia bacterium]|nr:hypothetical protein [Clostridia bacterium]